MLLLRKIFTLLLLVSVGVACRQTRFVPEGAYLLKRNHIEVEGQATPSEDYTFLRQQPNDKLLGLTPLGLHVYNLGGVFRKNSKSAPVILNEDLAYLSAKQLEQHYFNQGYFRVKTSYQLDRYKPKKVRVNYFIEPGPRFIIGEYEIDISSDLVMNFYSPIHAKGKVSIGAPLDFGLLDNERSRITDFLKNNGFFNFTRDLLNFEVDTSRGPSDVGLKLVIKERTVRDGNRTRTIPHRRARIYAIECEVQPSLLSNRRRNPITMDFRNIEIDLYGDFEYKPRIFYDVMLLDTGQLYNETRVRDTYRLFSNLKLFSTTEVSVEEVPFVDSSDSSFIPLVARFKLTPYPKNGLGAQFEVTNTSGNRGVQSSLTWMIRNVFNGGEIFNIKVNGAIEAQVIGEQTVDRTFNTFELGAELSLEFPRFLLPISTLDMLPKRMEPKSRVSIGASRQNRIEFDRVIYRLGLGYSWRESARKLHQLELMEFNYVRLLKIDPRFFEQANFLFGFRNIYISATRHSFTYNTQRPEYQRRAFFFRGVTELAGTSSWLIDRVSELPTDSLGVSQLFGVAYAQYAKLEGDVRFYRYFDTKSSFVSRLFAGYIRGFGNSFDPTYGFQPPFERRYFMGGSNDHRAFQPYRIGPGNNPNARAQFNTAPIKLLLNLEYRFTMYKALKGALFTDLGNIFYENLRIPGTDLRVIDLEPEQVLTWRNLYEGMAIGAGIGFRYDFTFVIVRLDVATALHNPILPLGSRWVAQPWRVNNYVFNFAIGYPF